MSGRASALKRRGCLQLLLDLIDRRNATVECNPPSNNQNGERCKPLALEQTGQVFLEHLDVAINMCPKVAQLLSRCGDG